MAEIASSHFFGDYSLKSLATLLEIITEWKISHLEQQSSERSLEKLIVEIIFLDNLKYHVIRTWTLFVIKQD